MGDSEKTHNITVSLGPLLLFMTTAALVGFFVVIAVMTGSILTLIGFLASTSVGCCIIYWAITTTIASLSNELAIQGNTPLNLSQHATVSSEDSLASDMITLKDHALAFTHPEILCTTQLGQPTLAVISPDRLVHAPNTDLGTLNTTLNPKKNSKGQGHHTSRSQPNKRQTNIAKDHSIRQETRKKKSPNGQQHEKSSK